jgi:hypothetical protein
MSCSLYTISVITHKQFSQYSTDFSTKILVRQFSTVLKYAFSFSQKIGIF